MPSRSTLRGRPTLPSRSILLNRNILLDRSILPGRLTLLSRSVLPRRSTVLSINCLARCKKTKHSFYDRVYLHIYLYLFLELVHTTVVYQCHSRLYTSRRLTTHQPTSLIIRASSSGATFEIWYLLPAASVADKELNAADSPAVIFQQ